MKIAIDLSRDEWKRFSLLAIGFFCIIGSYWMLRVLKNALFMEMVGHRSLPYVKLVSLGNLFVALTIYNLLVDWLGRRRLIRWLYTFYVGAFLLLAAALASPTFGLGNGQGNALLGWVLYVTIESYGSLGVLLLWSYVISITEDEQARRGFPFLAAAGNFGALVGTSYVSQQAEHVGVLGLLMIAAATIAVVPIVLEIFMRRFGGQLRPGVIVVHGAHGELEHRQGGVLEGLILIARRPYLTAILAIVMLYEMTGAFFDYQMNAAAHDTLIELDKVTSFLALYGVSQSTLSLVFAVFGTTTLIRTFGLTTCLILFPLTLATLNGYIQLFPGLWSFFVAQVGT